MKGKLKPGLRKYERDQYALGIIIGGCLVLCFYLLIA